MIYLEFTGQSTQIIASGGSSQTLIPITIPSIGDNLDASTSDESTQTSAEFTKKPDTPYTNKFELFQQTLRSHGIESKDVTVVLPLSETTLSHLRLPHRSENELKNIFALQQESSDELFIWRQADIICDDPQNRFVRYEANPQKLETIRLQLEEVGYQLRSAIPKSALITQLATKLNWEGVRTVILSTEDVYEIALLQDKEVIAQTDVRKTETSSRTLPGAIIRLMYASGIDEVELTRHPIICLGGEEDWNVEADFLTSKFSTLVFLPLQDTFRLPYQVPAKQAGPILAALCLSDYEISKLNFLPQQNRSFNWKRAAFAGATALLLICGFSLFWITQYYRDLEQQVAKIQLDQQEFGKKIDQFDPKVLSDIEDWLSASIRWDQELDQFVETLPEEHEAYLTALTLEAAEDDQPASISASGYASTIKSVVSWNEELLSHPNYDFQPPTTSDSQFDEQYPILFDVEVQIPKKQIKPAL